MLTARILYAGDLSSSGCCGVGLRRSSVVRLRGVGRSAGAVGRTLGGGVWSPGGVGGWRRGIGRCLRLRQLPSVLEFLAHTNGMKKPPASTHEPTAWRIGFRAGLAGNITRIPPPGIDCRAYVAGLIEGRAARGQRVVRLPVGKK
jgi:hypothetical protein